MCFPTWISTALPIRVSLPRTRHSSFTVLALCVYQVAIVIDGGFEYFNYCLVLEKLSSMSFRCQSAWCCRRCVSRSPFCLLLYPVYSHLSSVRVPYYPRSIFIFIPMLVHSMAGILCANKRHSHTKEYVGLLAWQCRATDFEWVYVKWTATNSFTLDVVNPTRTAWTHERCQCQIASKNEQQKKNKYPDKYYATHSLVIIFILNFMKFE